MLGLAITPHLTAHESVASEMCWWVDPTARGTIGLTVGIGLRLLRAAENWAKQHGATVLEVGAFSGADKQGELYERLWFRRQHVTYLRCLEHGA
jgi:hypothetical protein